MPVRFLVLLAVISLAACQAPGAGPTAPAPVEVSGVVRAGPVCPVVTQPADPACDDRLVSGAVMLVTTPDGREVARATSGDDGGFTLHLAPGDYVVVPQPVDGLMGTAAAVDVRVVAGEAPAPLSVTYDTGIR